MNDISNAKRFIQFDGVVTEISAFHYQTNSSAFQYKVKKPVKCELNLHTEGSVPISALYGNGNYNL